jgi:ElaA protein
MTFFAKTFDELTTLELYEILKSRCEIFTVEQSILYQDMDDVDKSALHCFFTENERVVGYLRAYKGEGGQTKIGRVLSLEHGKGIGKMLIENSLPIIKEHFKSNLLVLNSQTHAIGFYEKFGFKTVSKEFLEAGIPHVKMEMMI